MQAVVYSAAHTFAVRDVPVPEPQSGEVRIRCLQMGFCGTDIHLHHGGFGARFPLIPGHEVVGVVDRLGPGVTHFSLGEQVSVNPNVYCGRCDYCRAGRLGQCIDNQGFGVNRAGFFAEFAVAPAVQVFSVEGLDLDTAVFTEPASCAMHGLETLRPRPGSRALVFGAGPTGLLLAQLLATGGVAHLTVADPAPEKLARASALGIDQTVAIDLVTPENATATIDRLRAAAPGGEGYDVVVEATGSAAVGALCLPLARSGGTVLIYGVAGEQATFPIHPYDIFRRELTLLGSFAEATSFEAGIAALRSGRVKTTGIITHRIRLADYADALDTALNDPTAHKIIIVP